LRNLLIALGLCLVAGKGHLLFDGDAEWYAYQYGSIAQQFILSVLLYTRYGYEALKVKSAAYIICVLPPVEAILLYSDAFHLELLAVTSIVTVGWLAFAIFRSYEINSVVPDIGRVYMVTHKPDDFKTFVVSLFNLKMPLGGSGVWINGNTYSFHHGKFEMHARLPANTIFIETGIESKPEIEAYLIGKIGQHWTLLNNCLTTLWKVRHVQQ